MGMKPRYFLNNINFKLNTYNTIFIGFLMIFTENLLTAHHISAQRKHTRRAHSCLRENAYETNKQFYIFFGLDCHLVKYFVVLMKPFFDCNDNCTQQKMVELIEVLNI